jgi:hypothetical protein
MKELNCVCLVAVVMACSLTSCRVASTSFQVDSDNQAPALGIQLAPKSKQPAAESRIQQASAVENVSQTEAKAGSNLGESDTRPSAWSKLLGRFRKPQRIPLPRTDQNVEDALEE